MSKRKSSDKPSGRDKKKLKKAWGAKQVLASPYTATMPSPAPASMERTIQLLKEAFPKPLQRPGPTPPRHTPQKKGDRKAWTQDGGAPDEATTFDRPAGFLLGINQVTKGLERKTVGIVVIHRDVNPDILVAHVPGLCYVAGAKLVVLPGDGARVAQALGVRRSLGFAIMKEGEMPLLSDKLKALAMGLSQLCCQLDFGWLGRGDGGADDDGKRNVQFPPNPLMIEHRGKEERAGLKKAKIC